MTYCDLEQWKNLLGYNRELERKFTVLQTVGVAAYQKAHSVRLKSHKHTQSHLSNQNTIFWLLVFLKKAEFVTKIVAL